MLKIFFLIGLIFSANCSLGEVSSWVDNNPVRVGDMFNLHIEAKNVNVTEKPDIKGIKGLQVINRSEQNQTSIVGNKITRIVKWTYVLLAPSPGKYQIPSLKVGKEYTNPIFLEVVETQKNRQNEIVRLDLSLSSKKVYPQQQIIIKLKIIRNGMQLVNESITPFELTGIQIEKIKETSYQKVNKGKKQLITEILYVGIPKRSGNIVIPQIRYQGDEINGVNLGSIFQKFGSYSQNRGRRIFSASEPQTIEVLPIPDGITDWWLPVNKLELEEKWDTDTQVFMLGEPITRTITINVDGAYADQIPELKIKFPEKIKSYSDQPILKTEKTVEGLKGIRIEKFALIPNSVGEIKLPEISVDWWDVDKGELRTSVISEKIINVLPSSYSIKPESANTKTNEKNNKDVNINLRESKLINKDILIWKIISVFFALIWIITILLWYFNKKEKIELIKNNDDENRDKKSTSLREATNRLKKEVKSGTPETLKQALIIWSSSLWKENPPKGLEQIAERLPELADGINKLNSLLYSNSPKKYTMVDLQNEFVEFKFKNKKQKDNNNSYLSNIYPDNI